MKKKIAFYICAFSLCSLATQALAADSIAIIPLRKTNYIEVPANDGDAAVTDVIVGKTFSSDNGDNITGTLTGAANGIATKADVKSAKTFTSAIDSGTGTKTVPAYGTAPLMVTGQTTGYGDVPYGAGLTDATDGQKTEGVDYGSLRFIDNEDGTVLDTMTGLIWLKNASCYAAMPFSTALTTVSTLANGTCSLTDGSAAGDWRVPNILELQSLLNYEYASPTLSNSDVSGKWTENKPFTGVLSEAYLTSTTIPKLTTNCYVVNFATGLVTKDTNKSNAGNVWAVRD